MPPFWRTCLMQVVAWIGLAAAVRWYFHANGLGGAAATAIAAAAALLAMMALLLAHSAAGAFGERRMLLNSGGSLLRDGRWIAVSGTIESTAPVRAPVSGTKAVAYEYAIRKYQRVGRGDSLMTWFEGKALAPGVVATAAGMLRLLTLPQLEVEPEAIEKRSAIANATDYLRQATFEKRDTGSQRVAALEREWTDDDGIFRSDKNLTGSADVQLGDDLLFEERLLRPGEQVCVFGEYSRERGGIVPHRNPSRRARVIRGSAAAVAASLHGRSVRYAVAATILAAAAIAIVYNFVA